MKVIINNSKLKVIKSWNSGVLFYHFGKYFHVKSKTSMFDTPQTAKQADKGGEKVKS